MLIIVFLLGCLGNGVVWTYIPCNLTLPAQEPSAHVITPLTLPVFPVSLRSHKEERADIIVLFTPSSWSLCWHSCRLQNPSALVVLKRSGMFSSNVPSENSEAY